MNKLQVLELLSRSVDKLHNAMDEIEDIEDNELPKHKAFHYLLEVEMELNSIIDDLETLAVLDGTRSGAV